MDSVPDVDDLRLVQAVAAAGSVGGAARALLVTQPSASARLARLERRVGVLLFDRDTRGARPTAAGAELVRQATHVLGHLERAFDAARLAGEHRRIAVGVIPSLAEPVLAGLAVRLERPLDQRVDHGDALVEWVAEGSLDAAVLGVADQVTLPAGVESRLLGVDPVVLAVPDGCAAPPEGGRRRLAGRRVVAAVWDRSGEQVRARLATWGAEVEPAATVPVALAVARRCGRLAAVPRSSLTSAPGEPWTVVPLPWRHRLAVHAVTGHQTDPTLLEALTGLGTELGLAVRAR